MLNSARPREAERASAWVVGASLLVLGCQAFASRERETLPFGPPPPPPSGMGPLSPIGPLPFPERAPSPRPEDAGGGVDAGLATPVLDAAPFEDAGPFEDAAVDASPAGGDAG